MSTSTLAMEAEILVRPRNATKKTPCPPADPAPGDRHQQPGFLNQHRYAYRTCISSTGRKRPKHTFLVLTRRGIACLFCGRIGDDHSTPKSAA